MYKLYSLHLVEALHLIEALYLEKALHLVEVLHLLGALHLVDTLSKHLKYNRNFDSTLSLEKCLRTGIPNEFHWQNLIHFLRLPTQTKAFGVI